MATATEEVTDLFDLSSIMPIAKPTKPSKKSSMLLFGRHRVGKSTFVSEACNVDGMFPVAWIAAEDGTTAFEGMYDDDRIDVFHCKTWEEIQAVAEGLLDNKTKYKTVVVDTLGQVQEIVKRDFLKAKGQGSFEMWDKIAGAVVWLVDSFHNHPEYNSFFIAHTEKVKDDTLGAVLLSPYFLGKKSIIDVPKIPDTIAYLAKVDTDDGEQVRVLQLRSTERIEAGSRLEHRLPKQIPNPKMQDYYDYITGKKKPAVEK